ncbi:l6202.3-like protein [Leishmania mexicana MHOM/GT/2001/U1103]|uniref:L6202.3-like protein n=1 Tax=Leishmania mexicana (strain MHOM/GT/2001/U1103) TaxID=929439 RepID=E9AU35_LEIMU|nr:l6202.3-like protein [Leishmania mexicana MHOM/GT/2001/U1103]CBZ26460.1 l6202.3-like protein [Leishmania mexicana MHOM/GT/2001/U1103]
MSVPVAGRRKGLSSASSPSSAALLPVTQEADGPSWLNDLDGGTMPPAAPVPVQALPSRRQSYSISVSSPSPVAAVSPAVQEAPAREGDPLAFLNEVETPPSATADKGWHRNRAAFGGTIALSLLPSSPAVPVLLREGGDDAPAAAATISVAVAFPSGDRATATIVGAAASHRAEEERQQAEKMALSQQLSEVERQLSEASQSVVALQKGDHPLAVDVLEAERMVASLRAKEAATRQQKAEEEAENRHAARGNAVASVHAGDVEEEMCEYRDQCVQRFQQRVEDLMQAVQEQQMRTAILRAEWETAVTRETQDDSEASMFEALLLRVQDGARHLKRRLSLQCSRVVAESSRVYLAAARQQRLEIFAHDTAARARRLAEHRARREEEAAAFHDMCRRTFQERADSAFGATKVAVEAAHRYHDNERRQRVATFQCQLASMTERSREMLEQQVRRLLERECASILAQQDAAAKEWAARQKDLTAQLQAFRSRAEVEVCLLRECGGVHRASVRSLSQTPAPPAPAQESLRSDMDRAGARMRQLALALRIKHEQQLCYSDARGTPRAVDYLGTGGACHSGESPASSSFSVAQISAEWQRSLFSLQHSREALRSRISDVKEASRGYAAQLQQRRTQLSQQQEDIKAIRTEWEQAVRGQLSRSLTAASSQVPVHVGLTTGALDNLSRRVGVILRAHQSLRATRTTFTATLSTWSKSLTDYRVDTERLLADIFQQCDLLRERNVQMEVDQSTLQSLQAQVDVLEQHVTEGAKRLALRKRCVDAFAKDLRAGLGQPHTLPNSLDPQLSPGRHKEQLTHLTQTLEDTNRTSAISDAASSAGAAAVVSDAHWQKKCAKRAPPLKRAVKKTSSFAHTKASSATPCSLVTRTNRLPSRCASDHSQEGRYADTYGSMPKTGLTKSDVDALCSCSLHPILPTPEGNHPWAAAEKSASPFSSVSAYVSSAVQDTSAAVDAEADEEEGRGESEFSTDLVPLGDVHGSFFGTPATCTR